MDICFKLIDGTMASHDTLYSHINNVVDPCSIVLYVSTSDGRVVPLKTVNALAVSTIRSIVGTTTEFIEYLVRYSNTKKLGATWAWSRDTDKFDAVPRLAVKYGRPEFKDWYDVVKSF